MRPLKTTMLNTRCRGRQGWPGGWTPWVRFGSGCPSSELQTAAQQSCQIRCSRQLSSRWLTTGCTFLQPSPRTRTYLPRQCRTWWPTTCLCFKRWRLKWSSWINSFQELSPKNDIKIPLPQSHKVFGNKARIFGGEKEPSLASLCVGDSLLMKNIEVVFNENKPLLAWWRSSKRWQIG